MNIPYELRCPKASLENILNSAANEREKVIFNKGAENYTENF